MKKTIEFLKKEGIIDKIQDAVNFVPKEAVDDYEKDPNMKEFQRFILNDALMELSKEKDKEFSKCIIDDIVYAMNIKKTEEGDKIASLLLEIVKEAIKK